MYKFLVLLSIIFIVSCRHDPFPYSGSPAIPGDTTNPPPTTKDCSDSVYFQPTILNLISSSCAYVGCHDGTGVDDDGDPLPKFTSYNEIMDIVDNNKWNKTELYKVLTDTDPEDRMPPDSPLPQNEINLLAQWFNEGAKNNACFECDTNSISYQSSIKLILSNYGCTNCHKVPPTGGANSSLLTKQDVIKAIESQFLLERIQRISGYAPMPLNPSSALDDCSIQTMIKWKENGYPD